jgi:hypothetical protein
MKISIGTYKKSSACCKKSSVALKNALLRVFFASKTLESLVFRV